MSLKDKHLGETITYFYVTQLAGRETVAGNSSATPLTTKVSCVDVSVKQ